MGSTRLLLAFLATLQLADTEPLPFSCGFEEDFCGMEQDVASEEAWRRHTGRTLSASTGPDQASHGSYYIYMEGTEQTKAVISTPPLTHSGHMCVRFHYSKYGQHINSFNVFLESQRQGSPIWEETGEDTNTGWHSAAISVNTFTENDGVTFISQSDGMDAEGHLAFADTAIDDLRITAGECNACDVNNGGCDHICNKDDDGMRCDCNAGYRLDGDGRRCFDVDECSGGTSGCSHGCDNSPGGYSCSCPGGYNLMQDQNTCEDIDECSAGTHNCADTCDNTVGSFRCVCRVGYEKTDNSQNTCEDMDECNGNNRPCSQQCNNTAGSYICYCDSGYSLADNGHTCMDPEDATECMTGHQCSQKCHNTPGSYMCSCGATYILAQDGFHCIDCQVAYQKVADSTQAFSSNCPTTSTRLSVSLQTCLVEACQTNVSVVAFVNDACSLKQCPDGDLQLIVGVAGWDIYVLNVTWGGDPTPALGEGFPLWQVLVGVFICIAVIVAVVVGVILGRRALRRPSPASGPVKYENSPLDTAPTVVPCPELSADKEAGVYSEITETSTGGILGDRDNRVVYQNSAFQGEDPYQGLGPTDPPDPQAYQTVN